MPPEQGPEWAPSAHARGLFAAANGSCGGGMLVFQAGKRVAMPQRQWLPSARAVASVTKPQEQCRRDGRSPRKRRRSSNPNPKSESDVRLAMGVNC